MSEIEIVQFKNDVAKDGSVSYYLKRGEEWAYCPHDYRGAIGGGWRFGPWKDKRTYPFPTRERAEEVAREMSIAEVLRGESPFVVANADCLKALAKMPDDCVDAIVSDPPYELTSIQKRFGKPGSAPAKEGTDGAFARQSKGFLGKEWDGSGIQRNPDLWSQLLRVLKPGGYALAFGGDRTQHRMICAAEDAGFVVRGLIAWHHSQGFPKSQNLSVFLDRAQGFEPKVIGESSQRPAGFIRHGRSDAETWSGSDDRRTPALRTEPVTELAKRYAGFGTALKPCMEVIAVLQKPLSEDSIARNVLRWGTGGLNIGECRLGTHAQMWEVPRNRPWVKGSTPFQSSVENDEGRFPPNAAFQHSPYCEIIDVRREIGRKRETMTADGHAGTRLRNSEDEGAEIPVWRCAEDCPIAELERQYPGASKFFPIFEFDEDDFPPFGYFSKPSSSERNAGVENADGKNFHPTTKPINLMSWLIRLASPPGEAVILDPFGGSGTTGIAALREGKRCILIEREAEYCEIATARIEHEREKWRQLALFEESG